MTIYHRIKVWAIKCYRLVRFGFKFVKPRGLMVIWTQPVLKACDYCGFIEKCVTLEGGWEVIVTICGNCLGNAQQILSGPEHPVKPIVQDHRGIVVR